MDELELVKNRLRNAKLTHVGKNGTYYMDISISDKNNLNDEFFMDVKINYTTKLDIIPQDIIDDPIKELINQFKNVDPKIIYEIIPTVNVHTILVFYGGFTYTDGVDGLKVVFSLIDKINNIGVVNKLRHGFHELPDIMSTPDYFSKILENNLPTFTSDFNNMYDTKIHNINIAESMVKKIKTRSGKPLGDDVYLSLSVNLEYGTDRIIAPIFSPKANISFQYKIDNEEIPELVEKIRNVLHRFGISSEYIDAKFRYVTNNIVLF